MASKVFIRKRIRPMEGSPKNYLCFCVEADRLWREYSQWCHEYSFPQDDIKDFLINLKIKVPRIQILDRIGETVIYNLEYQPDGF